MDISGASSELGKTERGTIQNEKFGMFILVKIVLGFDLDKMAGFDSPEQ